MPPPTPATRAAMRTLSALAVLLCAPACVGARPPAPPAPVASATPARMEVGAAGDCAPNDRMPVHRPAQVPRIPNARSAAPGPAPMPNACPLAPTLRSTVVYVPAPAPQDAAPTHP